MKIMGNCGVRRLVLAVALSIGLGYGTHASADYLIDLNSRTATDLGSLNATAINDTGQVVGGARFMADRQFHALITGANGVGMTDLGTLGGNYSVATGVNAFGQVAGNSYTVAGQYPQYHAFITGPNGVGMTDLGTLGGNYSGAYGINAAGQVVGSSGTATGGGHAFITGPDGVGMTDLGTLGGDSSRATGINDAGQVVGYSKTATGQQHAFITGPDGVGMTDLGTLSGYRSWASGINDAGQVVGTFNMATGEPRAFITGPNGVDITDLNSLVDLPAGVVLAYAVGINNMGQVVVVPEPESYALMLAGLILMGVMVRRKQEG